MTTETSSATTSTRKPLEAILYLDVATARFNEGLTSRESFDIEDVADSFCEVYNGDRRLNHFRIVRGPSASGRAVEVTDADAKVDVAASDAMLEKVHLKLWRVIAFC